MIRLLLAITVAFSLIWSSVTGEGIQQGQVPYDPTLVPMVDRGAWIEAESELHCVPLTFCNRTEYEKWGFRYVY